LGYCFKSLIYESEVESESVKGDLSSVAAAEVHGATEGAGAVVVAPQKAQVNGVTKGAGAVVAVPQKAQVRWSRRHRRRRCEGFWVHN